MGEVVASGHTNRAYAKEYARFCRLTRLFLVDGLEPWRRALIARGVPGPEINRRLAAAAELIRSLAGPAL